MKVVHVITGLATGGAERSLVNLCCAREASATRHHVISLLPPAEMAVPLREAGVRVDHVGMVRGLPTPAALFKLVNLLRTARPDFVQGWMYHGNVAASFGVACLSRRVPVGWNIRNSLYTLKNDKPLTRGLIRLHRWMSPRPRLIVYNGRLSRQQHQQFGFCPNRAQVIPNGFDLQRFVPDQRAGAALRQSLGIPAGARVVGNMARLHPVKDHGALLQALAPLMERIADLHAVFVGRNVALENPMLAEHFSSLPTRRVHCLGERKNVEDLLPALDVFCSSSYAEAFPNALAEAMACGVPCVTTDAGDSAHIVDDTGTVVPVRDVAALSRAMAALLDLSREERAALGHRARSRIEAHFSISAAVLAYDQAWRAALEGGV